MGDLNVWCILVPVLIGIVSAVIGYFWGKSNGSSADPALTDSLLAMEHENRRLKKEQGSYLSQIKSLEEELAEPAAVEKPKPKRKAVRKKETTTATAEALPDLRFDAEQVKADYGKRVKFNDLKIIEGVGPKIESLFHEAGIHSWQAVAESSVDECREVLAKGGDRFRMHDPSSWPLQAKLAHENKWLELAKWQEEHKGGRL
jgi:predicted flap endonuclease-1-like 5' DNA nuclease